MSRSRKDGIRRTGMVTGSGLILALTGSANAISVGQPETFSHIAQPLQVRLPLTLDPEDVQAFGYQARLLPSAVFSDLGLVGSDYSVLDFTTRIVGEASSGYWISIESNRAIREPILSLLLEVRNARTTWVRSIDLLLDPPELGSQAVASATAKQPSAGATLAARRSAADASASAWSGSSFDGEMHPGLPVMSYLTGRGPVAHLPRRNPPAVGGITHYYGPVRPGESLSRIAQRARLDPAQRLEELVDAIYAANPRAFSGGKGELATGVILAIPAARESGDGSFVAAVPAEQPAARSLPLSSVLERSIGRSGGRPVAQPAADDGAGVAPQLVDNTTNSEFQIPAAPMPTLQLDWTLHARAADLSPLPRVGEVETVRPAGSKPDIAKVDAVPPVATAARSGDQLSFRDIFLGGSILFVIGLLTGYLIRRRPPEALKLPAAAAPVPVPVMPAGSEAPRSDVRERALHLRTSALLALDLDGPSRKEVRIALNSIKRGDLDAAEDILNRLEAEALGHETDKIVNFRNAKMSPR